MFKNLFEQNDTNDSVELAIAHLRTSIDDKKECFTLAASISRLKHESNGKIAKLAFSSEDKDIAILIASAFEFIEEQKEKGLMPLDYTPNFEKNEDEDDCDGCEECNECESSDESASDKINRLEEEIEMTVSVLEIAVQAAQKIGEKYKALKAEYAILENGLKDLTAKYGR